MSQENSSTKDNLPVSALWKLLLGLNIAFLVIALVGSLAFRSLAGLELLLWFWACEAILLLIIFIPAFLFHWIWRRQKPSIAVRRALEAFVDGIGMLSP